jgi:hypothetical protein
VATIEGRVASGVLAARLSSDGQSGHGAMVRSFPPISILCAEVASIHSEPIELVPYYERGIMLRELLLTN